MKSTQRYLIVRSYSYIGITHKNEYHADLFRRSARERSEKTASVL